MQASHALLVYSHWLINVGFIVSLLFAPLNSLWWPWWQQAWGWNIVSLEACIAGDLLSSFLFVDFHVALESLQWVTITSLTLTIAIIIWRTAMIWRTQRLVTFDARDQARAGYERYRLSCGGRSAFGDAELPDFDHLPPDVQRHWTAAFMT